MSIIMRLVLSALAFLAVANLVPGISVASFWTALVLAILWGLISITIRPVVLVLTLPINILTLGIFTFILNGFFLWLPCCIVTDDNIKKEIPVLNVEDIQSVFIFERKI